MYGLYGSVIHFTVNCKSLINIITAMRWTTLFSILCCASNFVMAFAILAAVSYNLSMTSTKEDRFPLPIMRDWRDYLTQLIPAAIYIITMSVVSCWAVTRRRKPYSAALVLILHLISLGICTVYCSMIYGLIEKADITPEEIKNRTEKIFQERAEAQGDTSRWVPVWLIEVQSRSSTCCGIISFQDWGRFWPKYPGEVPESCCRRRKKCITVVDQIEWPSMPSDHIKNDEGCASLIVETAGNRIFEVVKFLVILMVMLGLSLVVFIFQYSGEFCFPTANEAGDPKRNITNLTIGETWARMGFGRNKTNMTTVGFGLPDPQEWSTQPGSYTDIFIKQTNSNVPSLTNSITPNFADSDNIFTAQTLQQENKQAQSKKSSLKQPAAPGSQLFDSQQLPKPFNFNKTKKDSGLAMNNLRFKILDSRVEISRAPQLKLKQPFLRIPTIQSNMKWTVLVSVTLCAVTFVAALSFLAVSCFNLASTENLFPLPGITEWRGHLIHIIIISILIMLLTVCSCWGATRRNGFVALAILLFHVAAFSVCIVYTNIIYHEAENCQDDAGVIKNRTMQQFVRHRSEYPEDLMWVPDWLESVQKQSPSCCGIVTFEDWREFWPENFRKVPKSCCRNDDSCVADFDEIEWPKKPADYIKNDEGCSATMSKNAARRVNETLKFLIVLIVLLAISISGLTFQFIIDYWTASGRKSSYEESLKPSCFSWARVKFQRKPPGVQQSQNDPNGNTDNANIDQLAEVGSYSYTYLQQLKQELPNPQTEELNDAQAMVQQYNNNPKNNRKITYAMPQPDLGSSQSLQDDQQPSSSDADPDSNPQRIPIIYPDDTEKQNLKQLLRFGRRHRRHRKTELDPDRQQ
ncbi:unnamed protein product [Allacma fusca]|uniref:Tetraspanin n=1 Tax=Allacma fusca TaxID=39272 RepID=A0A8J2LEV8_9HEXA|nr:unnamed protein product [Allacma fusca]